MDADQIQLVRRFNRAVTRRVGALDDSYLRRGRPLSEARLVFEVGGKGADVRALRNRLGLDSGYLSRLLRSLEAQGLVAVDRQPGDGRLRRVSLTPEGHAERDAYAALSDKLAESMLAPLSDAQRERLVGAMAEVERLIRAAAIEIGVEPAGSVDARWCLRQYYRELDQRFEGGFDVARGNADREEEMTPPAGYFVMARLSGEPVGCGVLRRHNEVIGEIKRVWIAPSARGLGAARKILHGIESIASECGLTMLRLDTNRALKEAHALYRKEGFSEVPPFNDNPYAHHWFEKRL
jgi:DNA-binding MarR family transcriptional regulator/ribosomal protein S18 acetylase RimI-like enzyme